MLKLRSAYNYLCSLNYTHILVCGLVLKSIIFDVSYASFLLTIPFLTYDAYRLYIKMKTPEPIELDAELRKELDNIKSKLNAGSMEKNIAPTVKRYF
jgi:hypothetical protein